MPAPSTPSADGKQLVNAAYHSAVVGGLSIGFAALSKKILKGATPKLDFAPYDLGMVILDMGLAMFTKDMLVKQGLIPDDILK